MTAPASPATDAHTMTPAQRQRAYRLRRKRAITDAIGEEARASRVTLLSLLAQSLAQLEDSRAERMHGALRNSARRVLHVLVTRYAIDLEDHP